MEQRWVRSPEREPRGEDGRRQAARPRRQGDPRRELDRRSVALGPLDDSDLPDNEVCFEVQGGNVEDLVNV